MADFRTATTVGARIAAIRKARGFASAKALADAIPGDSITDSILRNIEAGRKNDLAVAQLLNLAWALRVSPLFILAPLGSPTARLDLPNIIPEVQNLTTREFDAWISGDVSGLYRPAIADELTERTQLEVLHEFLRAQREATRLRTVAQLTEEAESLGDEAPVASEWTDFAPRLAEADRRVSELRTFLESAGWNVDANPTDVEVVTPLPEASLRRRVRPARD